jgi:hypothetical protein
MQHETQSRYTAPGESGTSVSALTSKGAFEAATSRDEPTELGQPQSISLKRPEPEASTLIKQPLGGIEELLRTEDGAFHTVQFPYSVRSDASTIFEQMVSQGQYARDPLNGLPFPTRRQEYGTTGELFATIKLAIVEQTYLSDENSALLTYWIFSTWCQDILPLAPGLAITGWAHEGDLILRILKAFCYHPALVAGITSATLKDLPWERKPTLLISDSCLSRRIAVLLGSSTRRGYLVFRKVTGRPTSLFDYFSSKAIFLGEGTQMLSALQDYIHINASPAGSLKSLPALPLSEKLTQDCQNQLLGYRVKNLPSVHISDFYAAGLSPEVTSIANALGKCIVDAPDLQSELISLLMPHSQQQIAERLDDLGTLAVGAALSLCHQGKVQILVGEIAAEVNRVLKRRGEKLQFSPEKVGHKLKKAGLPSRRMGAAGNGYLLDSATQILLHKIATAYGCVGSADDKKNLHCSLCTENE